MKILLTTWIQRMSAGAILIGLVGCQQEGASGGPKTQETAARSDVSGKDASGTTAASPTTVQPVSNTTAGKTAPKDNFESDDAKRAAAENMIYARIRIKMEDMIDQRAKMLKSGKDPSDVEVRRLEDSIMRARELLEENGEVVEPVEPPIVVSVPKK